MHLDSGDKEAVKDYLLNEPVDDMWNINLDLEEFLSKRRFRAYTLSGFVG